MCSQSLILKEILNKTIREMEEISSLFVNDSSTNFGRAFTYIFAVGNFDRKSFTSSLVI